MMRVIALGLLLAAAPAPAPAPAQETKLLGHIEALDRKLVRAETELLQGDEAMRQLSQELTAAQAAHVSAYEQQQQAAAKLGRRLGALTRMGPSVAVTALANVADLSALVDDQQLLRRVAQHDRALWAAHQASQAQMRAALTLTQERAQAVTAAQSLRRSARDALAQTRARKDRTLQALRKRRGQGVLGKELQLAQVRLSAVVTASGQAAEPVANGDTELAKPRRKIARERLPWPARGPLRLGFGESKEGLFGTTTFHNGWDIAAAAGSEVSAIASGVVAFADWLHGYGQVAIVEHPGGFHTVHGHLGRLSVQQGQRVRAGQLLGTVGDTGSLRGTVLYFEVRHRGVPEDPRLYLRHRYR